ncbi:uncharacterized protein LOC110235584 [Exaiptasia diaphana]|uniref:Uncharacterized protein n=1 Tax=Exaiptasia diaphana TaxID=2652724 RepID=A0A913WZT9_EXADI|nr:uncharacterized protein LOC110235584 [Exaiptasia diaphana]
MHTSCAVYKPALLQGFNKSNVQFIDLCCLQTSIITRFQQVKRAVYRVSFQITLWNYYSGKIVFDKQIMHTSCAVYKPALLQGFNKSNVQFIDLCCLQTSIITRFQQVKRAVYRVSFQITLWNYYSGKIVFDKQIMHTSCAVYKPALLQGFNKSNVQFIDLCCLQTSIITRFQQVKRAVYRVSFQITLWNYYSGKIVFDKQIMHTSCAVYKPALLQGFNKSNVQFIDLCCLQTSIITRFQQVKRAVYRVSFQITLWNYYSGKIVFDKQIMHTSCAVYKPALLQGFNKSNVQFIDLCCLQTSIITRFQQVKRAVYRVSFQITLWNYYSGKIVFDKQIMHTSCAVYKPALLQGFNKSNVQFIDLCCLQTSIITRFQQVKRAVYRVSFQITLWNYYSGKIVFDKQIMHTSCAVYKPALLQGFNKSNVQFIDLCCLQTSIITRFQQVKRAVYRVSFQITLWNYYSGKIVFDKQIMHTSCAVYKPALLQGFNKSNVQFIDLCCLQTSIITRFQQVKRAVYRVSFQITLWNYYSGKIVFDKQIMHTSCAVYKPALLQGFNKSNVQFIDLCCLQTSIITRFQQVKRAVYRVSFQITLWNYYSGKIVFDKQIMHTSCAVYKPALLQGFNKSNVQFIDLCCLQTSIITRFQQVKRAVYRVSFQITLWNYYSGKIVFDKQIMHTSCAVYKPALLQGFNKSNVQFIDLCCLQTSIITRFQQVKRAVYRVSFQITLWNYYSGKIVFDKQIMHTSCAVYKPALLQGFNKSNVQFIDLCCLQTSIITRFQQVKRAVYRVSFQITLWNYYSGKIVFDKQIMHTSCAVYKPALLQGFNKSNVQFIDLCCLQTSIITRFQQVKRAVYRVSFQITLWNYYSGKIVFDKQIMHTSCAVYKPALLQGFNKSNVQFIDLCCLQTSIITRFQQVKRAVYRVSFQITLWNYYSGKIVFDKQIMHTSCAVYKPALLQGFNKSNVQFIE